jgi:DNA uptake protein ComE-like DNA-binding protein
MSTAPGRFRPQPLPETPPGPSVIWRFVASSWLLLLLVPSGGTAWLAFGVVAGVARRRSWGIVAAAYAVAAGIAAIPEDPAGRILQGSLYLVALIHGLILNQNWLLLLWGRRENGLTIFGNLPGGASRNAAPTGRRQRAAAIPKEAEQLLGAGTARSDYVDDTAPQTRAERRAQQAAADAGARQAARASEPQASAPARAAAAQPAPDVELIDVNTANQRALSRLTGMDRGLAKAAITERTQRGGFGSLEDFAATAGLQPHEIVRLRAEAYCSARPRSKRSFGRRVDY